MSKPNFPSADELLELHCACKFNNLAKSQLVYADLQTCLNEINQVQNPALRTRMLGKSVLGRSINCFSFGDGKIQLLCWSQMHGDESTATAAILDIMDFLGQQKDQPWLQQVLSKVTLHLVPMLNPDGAELCVRQNQQGIDINRDAAALQSPEAEILKTLIDQVSPDYAFNLHDQSRYYATSDSKSPVAMAFMSPPGDEAETISPHRLAAIQLIGHWMQAFEAHLDGRVAKYVDGYSNKAFGDYASSQGVATILIESGEMPLDPTRQFARSLNFALLLQSMIVIATGQQLKFRGLEANYQDIPKNRENGLFDLLITNVQVNQGLQGYQIDIGLRYCAQTKGNVIQQLGDLSGYGGLQTFNAEGCIFDSGKTFVVEQPITLTNAKYHTLLAKGICRFSGDISLLKSISEWPIVNTKGHEEPAGFYRTKQPPSGLLKNKYGVVAAVLNGELINLHN